MYSGPIRNHINANGCCLTPVMLEKAIVLAGLTWGMPPAQVLATMTWALNNPVTIQSSVDENKTLTTRAKITVTTMAGLPIEIDKSLPCGTIQLRYQGAVLYEFQNLAIPMGFEEAAQ